MRLANILESLSNPFSSLEHDFRHSVGRLSLGPRAKPVSSAAVEPVARLLEASRRISLMLREDGRIEAGLHGGRSAED